MIKSTKTIIIAAALTMLAAFPLYSASIEEFQTEEYYGSGGLDLINAAEAYSKGYTGKGITIGINDLPVNLEHESFADKTGSKYVGSLSLEGIDWEEYSHGSHVGGIAAGSKNGKGMHGVAFDADIYNSNFSYNSLGDDYLDDLGFSSFSSYSQIKMINNSWAYGGFVDELFTSNEIEEDISSGEVFKKIFSEIEKPEFLIKTDFGPLNPIEEASKDRLLIYANSNDGIPETNIIQFLHWAKGINLNNLISVTATLNSFNENTHLERNPDGSITGDFINAPFSNLAKYYEDSTISAPGWNIYSSYAADKNDYILLSGTSMSSPFVTGGAALIQQAFPYMNGKQIGDVLLSTANSNINIDHPFCVASSYEEKKDDEGNTLYDDEDYPIYDNYAKLFYLDGRSESSEEQIKNDLLTYARRIKDDDYIGDIFADTIEEAIDQGNISVYYHTPIQEFVGQGILDVGKAVSGPGALNARRLEKDNISDKYMTDGQKTVMYEIDTKGYDSVWSNDIKEILVGKLADDSIEEDLRERYNYYDLNWISNDKADKWAKLLTKAYVDEFNNRVEKSCLEGLHVGLLKSGKGILKLEGNNTYKGATVVTDGTIAVNGSVAGDAYSENEGIIMGKGKINGTLYNNNIAIAGDGGVGNLTMGGLDSKGTLTAVVNAEDNTKFIVNGKANVDGSTVKVQGLVPGESYTVLTAESINGELANDKENSSPVTTFMSEYAKVENNEIKVVSEFSNEPNVINNPDGSKSNIVFIEKQKKAFRAIKNMYLKLMSDLPEGVASYRRSLRCVTSPQQIDQIMTLINLPAAQAAPALSAVVNNAAAQSMTLVQRNSMTGDILSSHFGDRFREERKADALLPPQSLRDSSPINGGASGKKEDAAPLCGEAGERSETEGGALQSNAFNKKACDEASPTSRCAPSLAGGAAERSEAEGVLSKQANKDWIATQSSTAQRLACHPGARLHGDLLSLSNDDEDYSGAWFKFVYNKGQMRDGAKYHGRSGIIGYDLKLTDTKSLGLFFGHGNNTLDGFDDAWAKNKIEENKFGVYASKKNDKASGYLYLDYGKIDNELNRTLTNLDLSTNVKYKGNLFEIGGEYKLTPNNQKNKSWKVYPYINLQFSKYKQDGYHEKDGGIFNQVVESKTNNYAAGQLGLEFNFSNEKENYVLRLAGKTAFSGYEPKLTYSFEGDMANKYELDNDQDKNHMIVSFKGERKVSNNTLLSADFSMQRGSHDRDMKASLSFWKKF